MRNILNQCVYWELFEQLEKQVYLELWGQLYWQVGEKVYSESFDQLYWQIKEITNDYE